MNCSNKRKSQIFTNLNSLGFLNCPRYEIHLLDGKFLASVNKYDHWHHIVLSFVKGREDKDEIQIYNNAEKVATDKTKASGTNSKGNGRIIIGRHFSGLDGKYASVEMDELLFFNQALRETEITILSKYTTEGYIYYLLFTFELNHVLLQN